MSLVDGGAKEQHGLLVRLGCLWFEVVLLDFIFVTARNPHLQFFNYNSVSSSSVKDFFCKISGISD
jgi:hypothetical protein